MAGFELLAQIAEEREQGVQDETERLHERFREGRIPDSLYQALPD